MRNIRQNLFWAFAYNVVLIPVAMGALYPLLGLLLDPVLAVLPKDPIVALGLPRIRVVRDDGTVVWLHSRATLIRDDQDVVLHGGDRSL